MTKLAVVMNQSDLAHGEPGNGNRCPGAEAIYRKKPNAKRVNVGRKFVSWTEDDKRVRVPVPSNLLAFVDDYDDENTPTPKPIRFSLDMSQARVKERKITARNYSAEARRKRQGSANVKKPGSGRARARMN